MRKVIFIALSLLSVICYGQGIKISALPQAGSLIGNELTPIVQNGITKKTSVQSIANLGGVSGTFVDSIFQDGDSIKYTIGSEEYSFYNLPTGGGTTIDTSNFWNIHGNSGTNPATDFIGTTDYKDLRLKRNGNTNIEISSDNKGEHVYIMDSLGNKLFESTSMNGDFSANLGSDTTYVVADNGGGELDISSSTTVIHHPNGGACKMITQCDSIFNDSDTLTYLGTETYRYKEVNTYNANVTGSFKYANGTQGAGKVLTSDANGLAYWGSQILTDTATLDFGVITAHDQEILTITITGAVLSDVVTLGIPHSTMNTEKLSFNAWVSSADTVSIKCYNFDGSSFDPASGLFKIKVFK